MKILEKEEPKSAYLKLQKSPLQQPFPNGPNSESRNTLKMKPTWSFSSMVEYGKINREKHQTIAIDERKKREKSECPFQPTLVANKSPKELRTGDRFVAMYEKAMAGSKLITKHRSDRDPLDIDEEKGKDDCTFHPMTNHNTKFSIVK